MVNPSLPETRRHEAKDFTQLSQTKLTASVLSIGGEKSLGNELAEQMKLVATDVTVVVLKEHRPLDSGGETEGNNRRAGYVSLIAQIKRRFNPITPEEGCRSCH